MHFDVATERFVVSEWTGDLAMLRTSLHTQQQAQTRVQQVLRGVMQSHVEGTGQTIPSKVDVVRCWGVAVSYRIR